MEMLAWVKSRNVFFKVQEGTGDNLLREDVNDGYVGYWLWSTFHPECLDLDSTLEMECLDSGMTLYRNPVVESSILSACCFDAFGESFTPADLQILMREEDGNPDPIAVE